MVYARNKSLLPYFEDDSGDNIKHGALKKISKKNPASNFTFPKGFKFHTKEDKELVGSWGNSEKTTLISGKMIAKDGELLEDVTLYAGWAMKSQMTQWIYHDKDNTYDTKGQKVVNFYFNSNGVLWYEKERKTQHPKTVLDEGGTIVGTGELEDIFPNVDDLPFKFPKPLSLVQKLIGYVINKKESPLILDFFAGSGTTGQAIMDLTYKIIEKADTHNLLPKYILVTNNENNICEEVTYQRLIRSNDKYNYNSNLEYLKIQTLAHDDKKHSELDIKEFMVDKCTEIIKVKEGCFDLEPISNFLLRFNKEDKEVYVLQNIYDMTPKNYKDARDAINSSTSPIVTMYILALQNQNHYRRKFKDVTKQIVFEPLPENFLRILRKIQRKKR